MARADKDAAHTDEDTAHTQADPARARADEELLLGAHRAFSVMHSNYSNIALDELSKGIQPITPTRSRCRSMQRWSRSPRPLWTR